MECPEAVERGRSFRLLSEEELPGLLDFLTGYLPESLKFHQTLLTYLQDRVWEFHFYVAEGWPEDCICLQFPGMTLSPHGLLYESVGIFCPNDRLDLLRLLHEEDILIDWTKPLYINFVHFDIAEELTRLYERIGKVDTIVADVWACEDPLNADQIQRVDDEVSLDVQVLPLKPEHAEGIHELYPANDMECHELFLRLIKTLAAAGVFYKGILAAWMVQSYYGAMFSMQTKPEYRRKGYGTKLARYLTKRVADRGYSPFVVIRPENEASQSLYKKLGFRKLYQTVRMTFTPYECLPESDLEEHSILRDNLENAVRQLNVQRRVIDRFRLDEGSESSIDVDDSTLKDVLEDSNVDGSDVLGVEDEPHDGEEDGEDPAKDSPENEEVAEEEEEPAEEKGDDTDDRPQEDVTEDVN